MKIRFRDALSVQDREHLNRILDGDRSSKVVHFVQEATYIDDGALQAFKELAQADRESLISEFVWRITCHLEGSVTNVRGMIAHPLGKKFLAVHTPDGLCLDRAE